MKKTILCSLLACAALSLPAAAAVVRTTGAGSATPATGHITYAADFEGNTALSNTWSEGGLVFTQVNALAADNGGCGYAGVDCVSPGQPYSESFSDNYFGTAGYGAYLSIRSETAVLQGLEFAVDSGFGSIFVAWQTYLDGVLTGTGKASMGASGIGGVLGLSDLDLGFNEVRVYTFDSASDNISSSNYSMPAIDSVRGFALPEPGSLALVTLAGLCAAALRRRRG